LCPGEADVFGITFGYHQRVGGTLVGTALTLFFLPALYAAWFWVGIEEDMPSALSLTAVPGEVELNPPGTQMAAE